MPNLLKGLENPSTKDSGYSLDKLELLNHYQSECGFQPNTPPPNKGLHTLKKKAKNKWFSNQLSWALMQLDTPLKKAYQRTYFDCCNTLMQEGNKITSKYCGARWCNTCNRIRTAKLLNGYEKPLTNMQDLQFVTLTIRNVSKEELHHTIVGMQSNSTNIIRSINRKYKSDGRKFNGIRKIECTYNDDEDSYHPHLHFVVQGKDIANDLIDGWLRKYPTSAARYCQDRRDAYNYKELFKYTTKIVTTSKVDGQYKIFASALDTIFQAMKGMRTFQSFGDVKKVNEEIDNLQSETFDAVPYYDFVVWSYNGEDWVNMLDGSNLTNYKPSKGMIKLTTELMVT